jgi:tetratricopeptide (TPR) repeat protein
MTRENWLLLIFRISLPLLIAISLCLSPLPLTLQSALQRTIKARDEDRPEELVRLSQAVVEFQPWRKMAWETIGQTEYFLGEWQKSIDAFQKANQAGGLTQEGWLTLGDAYAESGNLLEAEAIWRSLFKSEMDPKNLYERIVNTYLQKGEDLQAIAALQEWSLLDSSNAQALFQLGILETAYFPGQAILPLKKASDMSSALNKDSEILLIALTPLAQDNVDDARDFLVGGRALGRIKRWDLAVKAFRKAVELDPGYAEAWAFLGEAEQEIGLDGFSSLQKALDIDSHSSLALSLIAIYWRRQGDPGLAMTYLHQLSLQEPESAIWQEEMGNTLAEMGDSLSALRYFQSATNIEPGNAQTWMEMAGFCVRNGIEVRSIGLPAARESLILSPDSSQSLDMMGWVLMALDDQVSAERFLTRAVEIDVYNASAQLHLAQLYLEQENLEAAFSHLAQVLIISGEDEPVGSLARRLMTQYFQSPR